MTAAEVVEAMADAGATLHLEWAEGGAVWWLTGLGPQDVYVPPGSAVAAVKDPRVRSCNDTLFEEIPAQSWEIGGEG